jgi:hypothetical protein
MIYSVLTYTVYQPRPFLLTFCDAGIWHLLARRRFSGYIGTSVLRSPTRPSQWLVIHFWLNEEAQAKAVQSSTMVALEGLTRQLTQDCRDLGVFAFQPKLGEDYHLLETFQSLATSIAV